MLQLMVLYPVPTDEQQFERDYLKHLALLHEKTGIPAAVKPYSLTPWTFGFLPDVYDAL